MTTCAFPACTTPPSTKNASNQDTCHHHRRVTVGSSWMGEGVNHHEPNGDEQ